MDANSSRTRHEQNRCGHFIAPEATDASRHGRRRQQVTRMKFPRQKHESSLRTSSAHPVPIPSPCFGSWPAKRDAKHEFIGCTQKRGRGGVPSPNHNAGRLGARSEPKKAIFHAQQSDCIINPDAGYSKRLFHARQNFFFTCLVPSTGVSPFRLAPVGLALMQTAVVLLSMQLERFFNMDVGMQSSCICVFFLTET